MVQRHRRQRGFTLIELLIAALLFAVVMIGLLQLFDSSSKISKIESNLADAQESVRYTAYHLMRLARMAGGTTMPCYRSNSGTALPLVAAVENNVSSWLDPFGVTRPTLPGSDVLWLRGFFDQPMYFVSAVPNDLSGGTVDILATTATGMNQALRVPSDNQGVVFMGRDQYAVATVDIDNTSIAGDGTSMTVGFTSGNGNNWETAWNLVNLNGTFTLPPRIARVGFFEVYAFYVDPGNTLRRWRLSSNTVDPVAVSIGGLQVALGLDTNADGALDNWVFDTAGDAMPADNVLIGPPATRVAALRITVLGRTPFELPDWSEPATTFTVAEDMVVPTDGSRAAKWRTMQVVATLRNYIL
jgi:prepilin-type N-terminal cleavage/methylation domain-containing protein